MNLASYHYRPYVFKFRPDENPKHQAHYRPIPCQVQFLVKWAISFCNILPWKRSIVVIHKLSHKLKVTKFLQVKNASHPLAPLFPNRSFPPSVWIIDSKSLISLSRLDICSCIPRSSSICSLKTSETIVTNSLR